jgi:hypothetical protein
VLLSSQQLIPSDVKDLATNHAPGQNLAEGDVQDLVAVEDADALADVLADVLADLPAALPGGGREDVHEDVHGDVHEDIQEVLEDAI